MDLGISGRKAIVCAASKGLGRGCAESLAREGVSVTICARTKETVEATAADIRGRFGVDVTSVACDITTEEGRAEVLAACPEPDILVNNAGGPPPGDFRDWGYDDWVSALNANMLTAIFLIKATVDGMIEREFGRIVNITSGAVKAPIPALGLSNGARAGLTGFVAGISRQTVRHNVTINNLLPGPFDTDRLRGNVTFEAKRCGKSEEDSGGRAAQGKSFGALRHGRGVRRRLCLPVRRPGRLHDRTEPADRWRQLPRYPVAPTIQIGCTVMDLGLAGKNALVCGGSRGLGRACAEALAAEGVNLTLVARDPATLDAAAAAMRESGGVAVATVAGDITTAEGQAAAIEACPQPDILVNNAGDAPPRGDCLQWGRDQWQKAIEAHMLTGIMLMRAVVTGMIERKFGRIVNITSGVTKMPIANMSLANAPRLGLAGFVAGLSRETIRHNVTINNLLPGAMDTERFAAHRKALDEARTDADRTEAQRIVGVPAGRWGKMSEFGATCAFLCSVHAGFLTGQNIAHDGGRYPGVF